MTTRKTPIARQELPRAVAQGAAAGRVTETLAARSHREPIRADAIQRAAVETISWDGLVMELRVMVAEVAALRMHAIQALVDISNGCEDPCARAQATLDGFARDQQETD